MSSTSSEEKAPHSYDPVAGGSDTVDEAEEERRISGRHDEDHRERKRARTSDHRSDYIERSSHMATERYGTSRRHDADSGRKRSKVDGRSKPRSISSRDPSPAVHSIPPPRTGKRLRRAPQRWDGERRDLRFSRGVVGPSSKARDADSGSYRESDGEQTLSANSFQQEPGPPSIDDPFEDLKEGLSGCNATLNRRTIVDSFHTWQLKAVSKQAAQQKALHIYLKRKLRKRTTRAPEIDRLEEDALRNARNATFKRSASKPGEHGDHYPTTVEDGASQLVPSKLRLPLEAYLPRRVRASKAPRTPEDVLETLPGRPHLPDSPLQETTSGSQRWLAMPTVAEPSSLNRPKNNARYNAARTFKIPRPTAGMDAVRQRED